MTSTRLNKACVILGAGASYDVAGAGSKVYDPAWKPPLAGDLFAIERRPEFADILERYPAADSLAQVLATLAPDVMGVEDGLRRYALHETVQLRENFKFIPPLPSRPLVRRVLEVYPRSEFVRSTCAALTWGGAT